MKLNKRGMGVSIMTAFNKLTRAVPNYTYASIDTSVEKVDYRDYELLINYVAYVRVGTYDSQIVRGEGETPDEAVNNVLCNLEKGDHRNEY